MTKTTVFCILQLMLFFTTELARAQNILHLSSVGDVFYVKAGTQLSLDSLVLTPSFDLTLSGVNDLSKSAAIIHPLSTSYIRRVYQFSQPTPPFSGDVTLYYQNNELNGLPENTLTLNIFNGISWNAYINNVIRDTAANFVSTGNLTNLSLSELILASSMESLPVSFLLFNTQCDARGTILRWTISGEQATVRYGIESSEDGRSWKEVGSVGASGNAGRESNYYFNDNTVSVGNRFYRIVEYSRNGRRTLSSILNSNCVVGETFSMYPNPVSDRVFLRIKTEQATPAIIRLYDGKGALVRTIVAQLLQGNNQLAIDLNGLFAGIYTITAEWNNQERINKLVKE